MGMPVLAELPALALASFAIELDCEWSAAAIR